MLDSPLDSDSNLDNSDNTLSWSDSGHDSDDDAPQPVAPPSTNSSTKHLQAYIKQLQLEKGKLEEHNTALNATNASIIMSETIIDKLILGLAKKYALTMEMFLPDKVIFQTDCPDPLVDITSPQHYAKKLTEKAALVTELYASIDQELHPQMRTNSFFNLFATGMQQARSSFFNGLCTVSGSIFNMSPEYFVARYDRASIQQITDMIGWEAGKGKTFDVFKAPVLYPDNIVNEKKIFRNWLIITKDNYSYLSLKGYQGFSVRQDVI
ncbi:uncharacterized protein F5147DRAFT_660560 [Suillus discolor]|uniref:Uncharacterized protein n=1 Tax=Suillus discolor TaxID=1912936 RepID=A0A9P7JL71_9AGAM|nr:uncharacterized protein F5147DRAFT_660560 [Suillus discolor]KAG2082175.1 hypothetical protein F5147DRAFT_660560 [Suillus discolor]